MSAKDNFAPFDRLAALLGVSESYEDVWGKVHERGEEETKALLQAMGCVISTPEEAEEEAERLVSAARRSVVPPVVVLSESGPWSIPLQRIPEDRPTLRIAGQDVALLTSEDGAGAIELKEPLPLGVHQATLEADFYLETLTDRFTIIVAPEKGWHPPAIEAGKRLWAVNLPLYAVCSEKSWGVGDFADLKEVVKLAASYGADGVGLLPLHALPNEYPYGLSPYYPWSRLWLNPLYISLEALPFPETPAFRDLKASEGFAARLKALREAPLIDYEGAWKLKLQALKLLFAGFDFSSLEGSLFSGWRDEKGEALNNFAVFCALREKLVEEKPEHGDWRNWPVELGRPDAPRVKAFAREKSDAVTFHAWLQWLAETGLREAVDEAAGNSMEIGLYLDLALGVDPGGPDAWAHQEVLALNASAGCPPDPFSLLGQEWGLPPVKPESMRATGYRFMWETLEANFSFAGAARIDHAASLARLFWVPKGMTPKEGAYVNYPLEESLALLRALSVKHKCLVIGEDLGTIPEELREGLDRSGFFSYRLLMFEREWDKVFKAPFNFPVNALAAFATHDLPTMDGWWLGADLSVKKELGRYPDEETAKADGAEREADRKRLLDALQWQKLLPADFPLKPGGGYDSGELGLLAAAVHGYLARSKSAFMLLNLDDLLGAVHMQNLPGTLQQHPNWRRKFDLPLEKWGESQRFREILKAVAVERGRGPRSG